MLTVTSVLPCFINIALFSTLAKLVVQNSLFYQRVIEKTTQSRYETLDGLRGFLALGVFFHHAIMNYYYFQVGYFGVELSRFYDFLGQASVSFFFMITGFLFWSRTIDREPIISGTNLKKFYLNRFFRIYPMYWVSLGLIILIVFCISGFNIKNSFWSLGYELTRLISLLSAVFINGSHGVTSINTISIVPINAGVQWTLVYEIEFYLILPFLAVFSKPKRFLLFSIVFLLFYFFYPSRHISIMLNFLFGMTAAYIVKHFNLKGTVNHWLYGVAIFLMIIGLIFQVKGDFLVSPVASFFVFISFILIVSGNSLFGLLTSPAARFLGTVSYSIYLLHGIILFLFFNTVNLFYPIKIFNAWHFWSLTGICGAIMILGSALTYRLIEDRFLRIKLSN